MFSTLARASVTSRLPARTEVDEPAHPQVAELTEHGFVAGRRNAGRPEQCAGRHPSVGACDHVARGVGDATRLPLAGAYRQFAEAFAPAWRRVMVDLPKRDAFGQRDDEVGQ